MAPTAASLTISLPLTFANSFWTSPDYRRGVQTLYGKLQQGVEEDEELIGFIQYRADLEFQASESLSTPPPQPSFSASVLPPSDPSSGPLALISGGSGGRRGFSSATTPSPLSFVFRSLLTESVSAQANAHAKAARDLDRLVVEPFRKWSAEHKARLEASWKFVHEQLERYERMEVETVKLRNVYEAKCRAADEAEDDARFAPNADTFTPPSSGRWDQPGFGDDEKTLASPGTASEASSHTLATKEADDPEARQRREKLRAQFGFSSRSKERRATTASESAAGSATSLGRANTTISTRSLEKSPVGRDRSASASHAPGPAKVKVSSGSPPPLVFPFGPTLPARHVSALLAQLQAEVAPRSVSVPILGTYDDVRTGEEIAHWIVQTWPGVAHRRTVSTSDGGKAVKETVEKDGDKTDGAGETEKEEEKPIAAPPPPAADEDDAVEPLDKAAAIGDVLCSELDCFRLVGGLGNRFHANPTSYYQFKPHAFDLESELDRHASEQQRSGGGDADDDDEGRLSSPVGGASGLKRSVTISSYLSSALSRASSVRNNLLAQVANASTGGELAHVRARREALAADSSYRSFVRRLDRQRLALEEVLMEHYGLAQRWELDRLRAVKAVLLSYNASLAGVVPALKESAERSGTLQESLEPEKDLRGFIEAYRTGPYRPSAKVYRSFYHDEAQSGAGVFGIDLRERYRYAAPVPGTSGERGLPPMPGAEAATAGKTEVQGNDKAAVAMVRTVEPPVVIRALLAALDAAYAKLPNDNQRRKTWIYEVPLTSTHHLREAINDLPRPSSEVPLELLSRYDAPVLASAVKLWMLELEPPLGLYENWEDVARVYPTVGADSNTSTIEDLKIILAKLPKIHLVTLNAVIEHLQKLAAETKTDESDEMYLSKLGLSVGRTILRPQVETPVTINAKHPTLFLIDLIQNREAILPPVIERKNRDSEQARHRPIRKRTAPVDQRISRKLLSNDTESGVSLLHAQTIGRHGHSREPSMDGEPPVRQAPVIAEPEEGESLPPPPPPPSNSEKPVLSSLSIASSALTGEGGEAATQPGIAPPALVEQAPTPTVQTMLEAIAAAAGGEETLAGVDADDVPLSQGASLSRHTTGSGSSSGSSRVRGPRSSRGPRASITGPGAGGSPSHARGASEATAAISRPDLSSSSNPYRASVAGHPGSGLKPVNLSEYRPRGKREHGVSASKFTSGRRPSWSRTVASGDEDEVMGRAAGEEE